MDTYQSYYTTPAIPKRERRSKIGGFAKSNHKGVVKQTVKYLSVCSDPTTYRSVVRTASDPVIKTICNAALNVERGDVRLSNSQKSCLASIGSKLAS